MQTLLPPAQCSGRFMAAPLSISAISVPRLPRTILKQNSTPSLPLKLNSSSPSFSSFISHRQWKLPFTVNASSQSSPAFTPSNEESDKAKLDQVHTLVVLDYSIMKLNSISRVSVCAIDNVVV